MNKLFNTVKYQTRVLLTGLILPAVLSTLSAQTVTISGKLSTQPTDNEYIVQAISNDTTIQVFVTGEHYAIEVPAGKAWVIKPCGPTENPLNGVTTYDMVLIAKQFSGIDLLNSPYQIIAGDIDGNGTLESSDTIIGRQLITGVITEFPGGVNIRFVPADYVFPMPENPFIPHFPETVSTGVLVDDLENVDFVGIKIGDVNNTTIWQGGSGAPVCADLPSVIQGYVRADADNDCQPDAGEPVQHNWIVQASGPNGVFTALSHADGFYQLVVPPGTYDVALQVPVPVWGACNPVAGNVTVGASDFEQLDFSTFAVADCPAMQVDISTNFLRRCFDNTYRVRYCNLGTTLAPAASIDITFDPYFTVLNSTLPWASTNNNVYSFPVGDVAPGDCGEFTVTFNLSCDALLGQAHCTTAHIYPDTLCGTKPPEWDGANLVVEATCDGDSIHFTITNTGADMLEAVDYVVIEDIMIQMWGGSVFLPGGQSQTITLPANGSTWRVEVEQTAGHPFQHLVSESIEGCGENGSGTFSLGFVEQFPLNDELPFEDEDCLANIGSFDPNDKMGLPSGVLADHFIPVNQEIDYTIRFQNTGTDYAFNIVVVDTLSQFLDPASVRFLGSSHPCSFDLVNSNVLQFAFPNIALPDSNSNEPASHGFVRFSIRPKPDQTDGTGIENHAAIFFDFNAPVITNTTKHTLGEQYLDISNFSFLPGLELSVFPNPADATAHFNFKNARLSQGHIQVYNLQGSGVLAQSFSGSQFHFDARSLPPGMYLFRITDAGRAVAAGKLTVAHP